MDETPSIAEWPAEQDEASALAQPSLAAREAGALRAARFYVDLCMAHSRESVSLGTATARTLLERDKRITGELERARARIAELEAELAGFETLWGVRYGVAKSMDSDAEPDSYTTERESEEDARQWRDEYAAHGEVVTCRFSPWRAVDEGVPTPTENGTTNE